jgi:hypothetical protein
MLARPTSAGGHSLQRWRSPTPSASIRAPYQSKSAGWAMDRITTLTDSVEALTASAELQLIYETAPIGLAFLSTDCRYLFHALVGHDDTPCRRATSPRRSLFFALHGERLHRLAKRAPAGPGCARRLPDEKNTEAHIGNSFADAAFPAKSQRPTLDYNPRSLHRWTGNLRASNTAR